MGQGVAQDFAGNAFEQIPLVQLAQNSRTESLFQQGLSGQRTALQHEFQAGGLAPGAALEGGQGGFGPLPVGQTHVQFSPHGRPLHQGDDFHLPAMPEPAQGVFQARPAQAVLQGGDLQRAAGLQLLQHPGFQVPDWFGRPVVAEPDQPVRGELKTRRQGHGQGAAQGREVVVRHPAAQIDEFRVQQGIAGQNLGEIADVFFSELTRRVGRIDEPQGDPGHQPLDYGHHDQRTRLDVLPQVGGDPVSELSGQGRGQGDLDVLLAHGVGVREGARGSGSRSAPRRVTPAREARKRRTLSGSPSRPSPRSSPWNQ